MTAARPLTLLSSLKSLLFRLWDEVKVRVMAHTAADGAEVIEYVRFGIGMRLGVSAEDGALVFRGRGYIWRIAALRIPLPLGLFLGTAYVEERPDPTDRERFTMKMLLRHRWFGDVFRYSGRFHLELRTG